MNDFCLTTLTLELHLDFDLFNYFDQSYSLIVVVFDHLIFFAFFHFNLFLYLTFVYSSSSGWFKSGKICFKGLMGASQPTRFLTISSCLRWRELKNVFILLLFSGLSIQELCKLFFSSSHILLEFTVDWESLGDQVKDNPESHHYNFVVELSNFPVKSFSNSIIN